MCGRHHLRAWELGIGQHLVERDLGKVRKEQEQAAHLRSERALGQVELSGVGHGPQHWVESLRAVRRLDRLGRRANPSSLRIVEIEAGLSFSPL